MHNRYTYAFCLDLGHEEMEVEASFSVEWGSPESGRFGPPERYDPGSPTVVEDIRIDKISCSVPDYPAMVSALIAELEENHTAAMIETAVSHE